MDPKWARYKQDSKNHAKHLPIFNINYLMTTKPRWFDSSVGREAVREPEDAPVQHRSRQRIYRSFL